ncbi:MAG: hypothetical protein GF317_09755 [Candidatus Lokiarchaeota archaeon]|nr:hypothetical protein [Candidatus Lokiarchaeota archaeon]
MSKIKLKETDFRDPQLKYNFLNSDEKPIKKMDYKEIRKSGMIFNNPRDYYDSEYKEESWLLWGDKAKRGAYGYFLNDEAVKKAKELGYKIEIDSKAEKQKKAKIKLLRQELAGKIGKYIKENGEKPDRWVSPEGEEIETPSTRDSTTRIYGGGEWFVISNKYIWFVKNNGADGDLWTVNNVSTGGAGAIGFRIPKCNYITDKIKLTTKEVEELSEADLIFEIEKI